MVEEEEEVVVVVWYDKVILLIQGWVWLPSSQKTGENTNARVRG